MNQFKIWTTLFFRCSRVTGLIRSTNDDDTRGTGFRCIEEEEEIEQWDYCCKRIDKKSGKIVHCPTSDVSNHFCPQKDGCPIDKVRMMHDTTAPYVHKFCQVNDE